MRDLSAMFYTQEPVPEKLSPEYIQRELSRISAAIGLLANGYNNVLSNAPTKPEEGMIVVADGTGWNPGSGKGAYEYKSGAWVKL
jgi:hypothetical protein